MWEVLVTDIINMIAPRTVTNCIGTVEKEAILLIAYLNNAVLDHFDVPTSRSLTSNVTYVVLK